MVTKTVVEVVGYKSSLYKSLLSKMYIQNEFYTYMYVYFYMFN